MTTMTLSFRVFPTGDPVPNSVSGTFPVSPGTVNLVAATSSTGFQFLFWDVAATIVTTATAAFPVSAGESDFSATGWYLPPPGGIGNPGIPGLGAWAFSLDQNKVLADSPFAMVTPASAKTGSNSVWVSRVGRCSPPMAPANENVLAESSERPGRRPLPEPGDRGLSGPGGRPGRPRRSLRPEVRVSGVPRRR